MSRSTATATAKAKANGDIPAPAPGSPAAVLASKPGLRIRPYRPMRALVGALIVIAAVVAAIALYARIGNRTEVLALAGDVEAGEQITADHLAVVSISSDDDLPTIPASQRGLVEGQYAKWRLPAGSLLEPVSIQGDPLITPGRAVMSVVVPLGLVPRDVREGMDVALVVSPADSGGDRPPPVIVPAVVVGLPIQPGAALGLSDSGGQGMAAITVEIDPRYQGVVGEAEAVSISRIDSPDLAAVDQLLPGGGVASAAGEPATSAPDATTAPTTTAPGGDANGGGGG